MGSYILKREGIKMDDVVHKNQMKLLELKIETLKKIYNPILNLMGSIWETTWGPEELPNGMVEVFRIDCCDKPLDSAVIASMLECCKEIFSMCKFKWYSYTTYTRGTKEKPQNLTTWCISVDINHMIQETQIAV